MKRQLMALMLGGLLCAGTAFAQTSITKSMAPEPQLTVEDDSPQLAADSAQGTKPMLGVLLENSYVELPGNRVKSDLRWGAQIKGVTPNSAAEEAGLKEGDLVIGLNGKEILTSDDLSSRIAKMAVGDKVELKILRDEKEQTISATLKARPDDQDRGSSRGGSHFNRGQFIGPQQFGMMPNVQDMDSLFEQLRAQMDAMQQIIPDPSQIQRGSTMQSYSMVSSDSRLGIMLQNLTPQLGGFFGAPEGKGALIASVEDDSPAKEAGLQAGDVVVAIDGNSIASPIDAQNAVINAQGKSLAVEIIRDKKPMKLDAKLKKNQDPQDDAQSLKM
ncbi:PDZ domain-containing protein [Candidatus Sumerlaeota bacterium]|nr:PDZ domain-containing protein [Candidatus Sumerlaeota bacterium]